MFKDGIFKPQPPPPPTPFLFLLFFFEFVDFQFVSSFYPILEHFLFQMLVIACLTM